MFKNWLWDGYSSMPLRCWEPRMEIALSYDKTNAGIQILGTWLSYIRGCILHVRRLSIELLA